MTRETINYTRLGVEACEAFTEGPGAFADFVRTILSTAAPCMCFKRQRPSDCRNRSSRSPAVRDETLTERILLASAGAGGDALGGDSGLKIELNDQERRALGKALVERKALLIEHAGDTTQPRATQRAGLVELSTITSVLRKLRRSTR